jgi:hypothetical protein
LETKKEAKGNKSFHRINSFLSPQLELSWGWG